MAQSPFSPEGSSPAFQTVPQLSKIQLNKEPKFQAIVDALAEDHPSGVRQEIEKDLEQIFKNIDIISGQKFGLRAVAKAKLDAMIKAIDDQISAQVGEILHDPDFQSLEASWRGLESFVINAGLQKNRLEIRVMDISKEELEEHIAAHPEDEIRNSHLYASLYGNNLGSANGTPLIGIAADMYFGPTAQANTLSTIASEVAADVQTIQGMAKIAADCNAPFLSSVTPKLFGPSYKSWSDMQNEANDLSIYNHFEGADYLAPWRSMRKELNSSLTGFTTHRYLGREPYRAGKNFKFEEVTDGKENNYVWVNGVYALLENIAGACFKYDWPVQFRGEEGGGLIKGLPRHLIGPGHAIGPVDAQMTNSREAVLSKLGFMPLLPLQGEAAALFRGAQSTFEPGTYTGTDGIVATERAALQSCLPYIFLACRLSHYMTKIAWKKIGDIVSPEQLDFILNEYLKTEVVYSAVDGTTPKETLYRHPVSKAEVIVGKIEGKPGYLAVRVKISPHIGFEGANFDLSLDSQVSKAS